MQPKRDGGPQPTASKPAKMSAQASEAMGGAGAVFMYLQIVYRGQASAVRFFEQMGM